VTSLRPMYRGAGSCMAGMAAAIPAIQLPAPRYIGRSDVTKFDSIYGSINGRQVVGHG